MYDMNGYESYFSYIKKAITKNTDETVDKKLLNIWFEIIELTCKNYFYQYIIGDRESYELSDDELEQTYNQAGLLYSSDLLDEMCEEDLINVLVNESGELLYSKK